jgi:hypothetical protein
MPPKDLVCVQSVPLLLEEGDRVNAELQRAPAFGEMRQVGVPALAGLNSNREKATAQTGGFNKDYTPLTAFLTPEF